MPRTKRNAQLTETDESDTNPKRRRTKSDIEKMICKKKLDSLETEETQSKNDRFTLDEKQQLIEAFTIEGYKVFQDIELLHKYFPLRRKNDLKGLISRLASTLQVADESNKSKPIEDWSKLCQQMLGPFAKDKKVSTESAISDALLIEAEVLEQEGNEDDCDANYPELLKSFSQLMMGKFPDNLDSTNSLVLVNLFEHVNKVAESYLARVEASGFEDGSWLECSSRKNVTRQELAIKGLENFDFTTKKCPTQRDLNSSEELRALCLELPKIKRITDVLNPLGLTETLFSSLMK